MNERQSHLRIDQRFQFSALGKNPRLANKVDIVVGVGRTANSLRVRFDGAKSSVTFHRSYLEPSSFEQESVIVASESACASEPCAA